MLQNKNYSKKKYQWAGKTNINDGIYHPYPGIRVPAVKPNNSKESINVLPIQDGLPHVDLPEFEIKTSKPKKKEGLFYPDGTPFIFNKNNPSHRAYMDSLNLYQQAADKWNKSELELLPGKMQRNMEGNRMISENIEEYKYLQGLKDLTDKQKERLEWLSVSVNDKNVSFNEKPLFYDSLDKSPSTISQNYDKTKAYVNPNEAGDNLIIPSKKGSGYQVVDNTYKINNRIQPTGFSSMEGAYYPVYKKPTLPPPSTKANQVKKRIITTPNKRKSPVIQPAQTPITIFQPKQNTIENTTVVPKMDKFYASPTNRNKQMSEEEEKRINEAMYKQLLEERNKKKQYGGDIKYKSYSKFNK